MSDIKTRFTFEEGTHRYFLDDKPLTGVTTILSVLAKPALIQWSANMAVDYVRKNLKDLKDLEEVLLKARSAHRIRKEEAGDVGKLAHKWIEEWILGKKPILDPTIEHMTSRFVNWAEENEVRFIAAEKMVYSEKYWYAGTLDFLCEINNKRYLGDLKTSSGIYDEYFFQTAAYQLALQEMEPNTRIDGHLIINCQKDGGFNKRFSFEYNKNIKAFLGALAIYRRKGELERANPWTRKK